MCRDVGFEPIDLVVGRLVESLMERAAGGAGASALTPTYATAHGRRSAAVTIEERAGPYRPRFVASGGGEATVRDW